jgi:hypothetical protein
MAFAKIHVIYLCPSEAIKTEFDLYPSYVCTIKIIYILTTFVVMCALA